MPWLKGFQSFPRKFLPARSTNRWEILRREKVKLLSYLISISDAPETDFLVNLNDYQSFVSDLKELWFNANSASKSKIIQRLIHKVEVGIDFVVVHYNVDKRNLGPKIKGSSHLRVFSPHHK